MTPLSERLSTTPPPRRHSIPSPPREEPPTKRRRIDQEANTRLPTSSGCNALVSLSEWPDDILIHLLQFLDLQTLEGFNLTCRRVHFFINQNMKRLVKGLLPNTPVAREIQQLIASRSCLLPAPPKYSFAYMHFLDAIHEDFRAIINSANPVKSCPRKFMHPDVDFDCFSPVHINLFRTSHCYYYSDPIEHVARFWALFWEYKLTKSLYPSDYKERVASWAWERYSYQEILGIARFNGCYYSRLITSSLNCQRDALRAVLEIYKSRDSSCEVWNVRNGIPSLRWKRYIVKTSESEYRTGQLPPGIEQISVSIPITVTVSTFISPIETYSDHTFTSDLTGLDLSLSRLADFGNVFNATIDRAWEARNMEKTIEFQDYFDFVWGELMGEKAAAFMAKELSRVLDSP